MPNDAKTRLDAMTHSLQDQATTAKPSGLVTPALAEKTRDEEQESDDRHVDSGDRQPLQAQQRKTTGTTLEFPDTSSEDGSAV